MGFEKRHEAEQFLQALSKRFAGFGLELHPTKTTLIEFGRFARERRQERGLGKPHTFNFRSCPVMILTPPESGSGATHESTRCDWSIPRPLRASDGENQRRL